MESRSFAIDRFDAYTTFGANAAVLNGGPSGPERPPVVSLLEGPPLGIYRISAYINLGFVGACLLLLGIAFVFTHELGWLAALTAIASGATLSAFAWRRAVALESEDGSFPFLRNTR